MSSSVNDHQTDEQSDLPSGLVTFVFTDIEASTRLVKLLDAEQATQSFDLHNSVLRDVWQKHGGAEVNTEGDAFFIAFDDTEAAVAACVEAQQRLAVQTWPGDLQVRVRIGIHSGIASPHLDNYVSLAVHQAARVEAAGHGGQILATAETLDGVSVPVGSRVVPIGLYRLRDFDEPVPLLRIDPAGVPPMATAIRATPASHHNLIAQTTSFVGRDSDVAIVNSLIAPGTVVSLVGPGGIGKTRLATETGIRISDSYDDGVWMVELAEVQDEELFIDALAHSIGASRATKGDRWQDILEHLAQAHALLILDNLEQVLDAVTPRLADLVAACPNLAVLTTSRQPLDLRIEQVYRVQPLGSTGDGTSDEGAAAQLFLDRAKSADSAFETRGDDRSKVAAVCERLGGLPLAIEIAAARVRTMSINDLHDSLTDQLSVLRSRDRSLPDRHRTMHALLTWSYELLTASEQRALRRLSVFASDFSVRAARAVVADGPNGDDDPVDLLWGLVDKSLITIDLSESFTRYRLAESVQQFALEHLNDDNDLANATSAAADWYLTLLGPEQPNDRRWLTEIAIELTNLRGLVDLLTDIDQHAAQRIMCSVGRYHDQVGNYSTGVDELTRSVDELADPTAPRVALLATLADLHLRRGDVDEAVKYLAEAAELQPRAGRPSWDDTAVERTQGEVALRSGRADEAVSIATKAIALATTQLGAARMWNLKGLAQSNGDLEAATTAFSAELELWVELGLDAKIATTHGNLAEMAWRRHDPHGAAAHQRSCLELALLHDMRVLIACSLQMAARFSQDNEEWSDAVVLNAAAKRMIEEAGAELYSEDEQLIQDVHNRAIRTLGAETIESLVRDTRHEPVLDAARLAMAVFTRTTESANLSG